MTKIKSVNLPDIMTLFGHDARVQGRVRHCVVNHVMTESKKKISDHTLLFHLDKEPIHGKYYEDNEDVVIVTDGPAQCRKLGKHITLIAVEDVAAAYFRFVDYYRSLFQIPVVGITGTSGKTTTKEMIKHILRKDYNVRTTYRNVNSMSENLRYLLEIDDTTEAAVYEMPVAGPGYVRDACKHFQPNIRLLLNIGVYHLTDCETSDAYLKAKAEILEGLDPDRGILILNADDKNIRKIDVSKFKNTVYFGIRERSHFRANSVRFGEDGMNFTLLHKAESYEAYVPGYGEHNVQNALAAIAAASAVGVDIPRAVHRLRTYQPMEEHLEFKRGPNGCTVIDDTWNITPLSMSAALEVLNGVSNGRTKIAILGYMPRLGTGDEAQEEYAKMGEKAVETNVDLLIVVGAEAKEIGRKALELGMDGSKVCFCATGSEVYKTLKPYLNETSIILLKITHRVMVKSSFADLKESLIPDTEDDRE